MSNIQAPISETSISKINNNNFIITMGPGEWTENRTDGVIKSIDFVIKGWINDNAPTIDREMHNGDTINHLQWGQTGSVEESFNWVVPEDLQTTATWHGHNHPHDEENDDLYGTRSKQWLSLIKQTDEYITAHASVISQLEAL